MDAVKYFPANLCSPTHLPERPTPSMRTVGTDD